MPEILSGTFPVLPTPFDAAGAIDLPGFQRIIDYALAAGADGVVFPGLASEYDQLTAAERNRLVTHLGEALAGRVPFIVGASAPDAAEAGALAAWGRAAGAAAAMVMAPRALAGDLPALIAFYHGVVRESGLPIMLQNAPPPAGAGLSPAEVRAILAAVPGVRYVKEENIPCGQRISALLDPPCPGLLGVFGGAGGRYIIDELNRGAIGTMPASELVEGHAALVRAHRSGDGEQARHLHERMLPVLSMQAVFRWSLTKEVLRRRGLIAADTVRAPGPRLDAGDQAELTALLDRLADLTGPLAEPARAA